MEMMHPLCASLFEYSMDFKAPDLPVFPAPLMFRRAFEIRAIRMSAVITTPKSHDIRTSIGISRYTFVEVTDNVAHRTRLEVRIFVCSCHGISSIHHSFAELRIIQVFTINLQSFRFP